MATLIGFVQLPFHRMDPKLCQVQGINLFAYGMQLLVNSIRERLAIMTALFLLLLPWTMQPTSYQKHRMNLVMEFMLKLTLDLLSFPPLPHRIPHMHIGMLI